jgi:hypothetical protein
MKTLLAIALTVAALTIGTATVAPIFSTAVAGGGGAWQPPDKWCGARFAHLSGYCQERIVGGKPQ